MLDRQFSIGGSMDTWVDGMMDPYPKVRSSHTRVGVYCPVPCRLTLPPKTQIQLVKQLMVFFRKPRVLEFPTSGVICSFICRGSPGLGSSLTLLDFFCYFDCI